MNPCNAFSVNVSAELKSSFSYFQVPSVKHRRECFPIKNKPTSVSVLKKKFFEANSS